MLLINDFILVSGMEFENLHYTLLQVKWNRHFMDLVGLYISKWNRQKRQSQINQPAF